MEQKFQKWEKWLKAIRYEVANLIRNKHIFGKLRDIVKNNPKIQKPNSFYEFAGETYFASAVMSIRRQIKSNKDSISFARLLQEIVEMPCVLSRARFVALYTRDAQFEANHDFDQFARANADHIEPDWVKQDLDKLKKLGQEVEVVADKQIAHTDVQLEKKFQKFENDTSGNMEVPINIPSFGEIGACIDYLAGLTKKYWLLFNGTCGDLPVESIADYWDEIFRQPWIPPDAPNKIIDPDPLGMY